MINTITFVKISGTAVDIGLLYLNAGCMKFLCTMNLSLQGHLYGLN